MLTDSEKCGCARREGMEDEGSEGATAGNCRAAGMPGLGWGSPFAALCSPCAKRRVDVAFLGYREVVSVCVHRLCGVDGIGGRGPAMGWGGHPLTYSFPRDIFHVGKIIER